MFGWSARSWFYNCAKPTKKEIKERTHHWLADILSNHRERIVGELDVQKVLSYLVYEGVFSLEEYKDILSWECCEKKTAYFLEKLACKGPGALSAFCSVLEEVFPHLLISILLDYQGVLTRNLTSEGSENSPPRTASEMEMHHPNEARGLEGKLFAEEQINRSFSRSLKDTMLHDQPLSEFKLVGTQGMVFSVVTPVPRNSPLWESLLPTPAFAPL